MGWENTRAAVLYGREAKALSIDFASDVLVQCCSEWRLSRAGVLRWCRGWYAQQGVTDLPAALVDLPELTSACEPHTVFPQVEAVR